MDSQLGREYVVLLPIKCNIWTIGLVSSRCDHTRVEESLKCSLEFFHIAQKTHQACVPSHHGIAPREDFQSTAQSYKPACCGKAMYAPPVYPKTNSPCPCAHPRRSEWPVQSPSNGGHDPTRVGQVRGKLTCLLMFLLFFFAFGNKWQFQCWRSIWFRNCCYKFDLTHSYTIDGFKVFLTGLTTLESGRIGYFDFEGG